MNDFEESHFHPDSVGKSHVPIQSLKRTKSRGSAVKGKLSMYSFYEFICSSNMNSDVMNSYVHTNMNSCHSKIMQSFLS